MAYISALYDFAVYDNSRYNVLVISGSTSFGFDQTSKATQREYISGSTSFALTVPVSHLEGTGNLNGSETLVFTGQGAIEAKKAYIVASTSFAFIPDGFLIGIRKGSGSTSFAFDTLADIYSIGKLAGNENLTFTYAAGINRVRIYASSNFGFDERKAKITFRNAGPDFNTWGDTSNPYTNNADPETFDLLYGQTSGDNGKPYLEVV